MSVDAVIDKRAVVLLSGGLDSATVLAMAREQGYVCFALSFDYGQRHRAELQAAARVANALGAREHRVVSIDLTGWGGNLELWSVKDGVIHGETTKEKPIKQNTFLVWTNGVVEELPL